jgi:DNA-binding transcriptional ArsR family regulator
VILAEILRAAGEPSRLRILNLLRFGDICVSDIQSVLGLSQSTVSRHLSVLRHSGLVEDRREGARVLYALSSSEGAEIAGLFQLLDGCCPAEVELRRDFETLKAAVRDGKCRLDIRRETRAGRDAVPANPSGDSRL